LRKKLRISDRRACGLTGQPRATQQRIPKIRADEEALRAEIVTLATRYGRYGCRRITAALQREGWQVNHKWVERIWRQEGLKVSQKQPKRGRLWLNEVSCVRLRRTNRIHVWSYDFLVERQDYNTFRPHGSLGYRLPTPDALLPLSDMIIDSWLINKGLDRQIAQRLT
jgi:putative transposase